MKTVSPAEIETLISAHSRTAPVLATGDDVLMALREILYRPWANAALLVTYCEAAMPYFARLVHCIHPPEVRTVLTSADDWSHAASFMNHAVAALKINPFHGPSETCWYGWIPADADQMEALAVTTKRFTHYLCVGRVRVYDPLPVLNLCIATTRLQKFFAAKAAGNLTDNNFKLLRIFLLVAQKHFGNALGIVYPRRLNGFSGVRIVLSEELLATNSIGLHTAQVFRCLRDPDHPRRNRTFPCSNVAIPDLDGNLVFDRLE